MSTPTEIVDGIAQVREILVGAIQRDLEQRIAKLEAHVAARLGEVQQEARRRVDVIEAHLRKEVEALSARLEREVTELRESSRALTREQRESCSASDERVAKLEEAVSHAQHDLRSQILDQAKSFLDELHEARQEFSETLERELGGLGTEAEEETTHEQPEAGEAATAH